MRKLLKYHLDKLGAKGPQGNDNWDHVLTHGGWFIFSCLNAKQVLTLVDKYHIQVQQGVTLSRMSTTHLTEKNVEYVAQCIKAVCDDP